MNNNFNAKNITEITNKIDSTKYNMTAELAEIVASEDSNLASVCYKIKNTYVKLSEKLSTNLTAINEDLNKYIEQTLENEEKTKQGVQEVNESLESAKSVLDSL